MTQKCKMLHASVFTPKVLHHRSSLIDITYSTMISISFLVIPQRDLLHIVSINWAFALCHLAVILFSVQGIGSLVALAPDSPPFPFELHLTCHVSLLACHALLRGQVQGKNKLKRR